jgi:hypothetical protein
VRNRSRTPASPVRNSLFFIDRYLVVLIVSGNQDFIPICTETEVSALLEDIEHLAESAITRHAAHKHGIGDIGKRNIAAISPISKARS